jgi:hypothetical protein
LNWRNSSLYMIGGNGNVRGVAAFDVASNEWQEIKSDVPFNIWFPGDPFESMSRELVLVPD